MTFRDPLVARLRGAGCVWAEQEAALIRECVGDDGDYEWLAERRVAGVPLEQLLGWAALGGTRVTLGPSVFVPRRRTELVVALAVAELRGRRAPVLVDLCTGAGAIAAAVLDRCPDAVIHAVDVDPVAIGWARLNLPDASVHLGDLARPLPATLRGHVDVLTACAPYVPTTEVPRMPSEARDHEPRRALDGGVDGLDVVRRIAALAPGWLRPGGTVVLEVGDDQVPAALDALLAAGLDADAVTDDALDAVAVRGRLVNARTARSPR